MVKATKEKNTVAYEIIKDITSTTIKTTLKHHNRNINCFNIWYIPHRRVPDGHFSQDVAPNESKYVAVVFASW